MPQFPAVIDVSAVDGSNGFRIGGSIIDASIVGDVNGDGFDDLVVLTRQSSAYVVFGKAAGSTPEIALSNLDGGDGFKLGLPPGQYYYLGAAAPAGDVNGDRIADFILSDPWYGAPQFSGAAYVVFGRATGFGSNFNLSGLDGSNGFAIDGVGAFDLTGYDVSSAGDFNGDGFDDLIVSAEPHVGQVGWAGATYIVFGKASGFSSRLNVSSLDGSNGFTIAGEAPNTYSGLTVSPGGDINGDGFADVIITGGSDSYVVFGSASGFGAEFNLSGLNGANGFKINGFRTAASAGDINGDGYSDLIIGNTGITNTGLRISNVIYGKSSGFTSSLDPSSVNGVNGFSIFGVWPLAGAASGDVSGDGVDDLLFGTAQGSAYVVFGTTSGFGTNLYLSALDGSNGFEMRGLPVIDFWGEGMVFSMAGDLDNNGRADILVGDATKFFYPSPENSLFVVLTPPLPSAITGTPGDDTLIGTPAGEIIRGLEGSDSLFGAAGNDYLDGGPGIDSATFSFARSSHTITRDGNHVMVTGPDGTDTLTGIEKAVFIDQTELLGQGPTRTDFNTDLNADLLWQNTDGMAAAWLMNGTNVLSGSAIGANPGSDWHAKAGADFDGDGKADILWQNNDGTPVIWFMDGTTMLSGRVAGFNPGAAWQVIGAGDFNGDGHADILWQNADGTPAVWLMNGTALLSGGALSNPGTAWHVIGSGDFNGDGNSDILWQNSDGTAAIWLMNGTSLIGGGAVGGNPGTQWHVKAAGDFNADGKSDILWQNDNGTPVVWFMNGTAVLSGGVAGSNPGSSWQAIGASDFNGDGKSDIAWQNADGTPAIWLMSGTTLLSGTAYANPGAIWHVIASSS